ncbi:MAG: polysaccharide deacetylase family protein [Lachnospiraceae bacterium]|nr:polysaccharide deacetylase family protein [Lachnospiraceae bacterium]
MKKMQKKVFAVLFAAALLIGCVGCESEKATAAPTGSGTPQTVSPTEKATEKKTDAPTNAPTDTPTDAPTDAPTEAPTDAPETSKPYSDPNNGALADNGMYPNWAELPNKSIPYGNDWEIKEKNGIASGVLWYEAMYGKYDPVFRIKTNEKVIYLTMDEGYEAGYTPKILDILKEKNVKAVFFITKQFFDSDPELIERMIAEGHTLGNHTCLHPSGGFPNYAEKNGFNTFADDVAKLHKLIYDRFGYTMRLFRFPEGEFSERTLAWLNNHDYTAVFWSYAHRDWVLNDQPPVETTLNRCLSHLAPGSVYLLHAVSSSNTEALADFIDGARAAGYEFGVFPVDQVTSRAAG